MAKEQAANRAGGARFYDAAWGNGNAAAIRA